ncbi:hypothetical protein CEXT_741611 [Caerostris extrusa]|uniref:Uncharacterized protein n=1 Tax=Caerostris extrusa TaxID=172846 RepID=A0AAV4Q2N4_CAEEX|nr:hypothetical protein CEXT_741611 [Caerostris extrusa]
MSSDMANPTIDILNTAPDSEEIKRLLDSNMESNFDFNHTRAIVNQTDCYALLDKINAVCYNHSLKLLTTTPVTDSVSEVIAQCNDKTDCLSQSEILATPAWKKTKLSRKIAPTISKRNKPDEVIETSNSYDVLEVEEITIDDPSDDITCAPSMQNSVNNNDISGMNSMHIDEEFCSRRPVCVKCAGPHKSSDCPKPPDTPATCALCKGNHTANFSGCPRNPGNSVPSPTENCSLE